MCVCLFVFNMCKNQFWFTSPSKFFWVPKKTKAQWHLRNPPRFEVSRPFIFHRLGKTSWKKPTVCHKTKTYRSCWFQPHPFEKICSSKWGIFHLSRGGHKNILFETTTLEMVSFYSFCWCDHFFGKNGNNTSWNVSLVGWWWLIGWWFFKPFLVWFLFVGL